MNCSAQDKSLPGALQQTWIPGTIDVLIPSQVDSAVEIKTAQDPVPTFSYEAGHYDQQRPITIPSHSNTCQVFRCEYLEPHKPVKIEDYLSFNPIPPPADAWSVRTYKPSQCKPIAESVSRSKLASSEFNLLDEVFDLFPEEALKADITVQCSYLPSHDCDGNESCQPPNKRQKNFNHQDILSIHRALTVSSNKVSLEATNNNQPALFMGQQNQVTMDVTLQDVLIGFRRKTGKLHKSEYIKRNLRFYVAQASICSDPKTVEINPNGQIRVPSAKDDVNHKATNLSSLLKGLVIPSTLFPLDDLTIRDINFWFTAHPAITNTHYDSHNNLLMVLHGTKTVELMPPDSIQCSPFYSTHANHPAVLQPEFPIDDDLIRSVNEAVKSNTMVVSVTQGQALYIPGGWWHRVESSSDCMAINIWFDCFKGCSPYAPTISHMRAFYAREWMREAFEPWFEKSIVHLAVSETQATIRVLQEDPVFGSFLKQYQKPDCSNAGLLQDVGKISKVLVQYTSSDNLSLQMIKALLSLIIYQIQPNNHQDRQLLSFRGISLPPSLVTKIFTQLSPCACLYLTKILDQDIHNSRKSPSIMEYLGCDVDVVSAHILLSVSELTKSFAKAFCAKILL